MKIKAKNKTQDSPLKEGRKANDPCKKCTRRFDGRFCGVICVAGIIIGAKDGDNDKEGIFR